MNATSHARSFVRHRNDAARPRVNAIEIVSPRQKGPEGHPLLSVIIPTSDGYRNGYLPALLNQLTQQTCQQFETIVVAGDSRQGRAINIGADIARGRFLLTLDDDTRLLSCDTIRRLLDAMQKDDTIGMAGGINRIPAGAPAFVKRAMVELPRRSTPDVAAVTESDLAEHPLLMMRRDTFVRVGGENELMPRGLDPYLRRQFRQAGCRVVVVPGADYAHLPPPTFSKLVRQFFRNGRQSALCSRWFSEWLVETPDRHVSRFVEHRSLPYRICRHALHMLAKALKGHFIYICAYAAYAAGFVWECFSADPPRPRRTLEESEKEPTPAAYRS